MKHTAPLGIPSLCPRWICEVYPPHGVTYDLKDPQKSFFISILNQSPSHFSLLFWGAGRHVAINWGSFSLLSESTFPVAFNFRPPCKGLQNCSLPILGASCLTRKTQRRSLVLPFLLYFDVLLLLQPSFAQAKTSFWGLESHWEQEGREASFLLPKEEERKAMLTKPLENQVG